MRPITVRALVLVGTMLLTLFSLPAEAATKEVSFADAKVVLQISDPDPSKQTLILNVANNLIKHYGPDQVAIEIVAFGPGLRLLFADNVNAKRIQGLADSGVKFNACSNTIRAMTKKRDGDEPVLNPNATRVEAGIVRIVDLVNQGYILVKP